MRNHRLIWLGAAVLFILILLAGCAAPPEVNSFPQDSASPAPTLQPSPTPKPPRELNICIGQEPQTLYLYGGSSRAMWSVLEAVYDGPIDTRQYQDVPVILENLPDETNGGAVAQSVSIQRGQKIIAADGSLAYLDQGTRVRPAGCRSDDCALEWDGTSPLSMDQWTLTFRLKPGLLWSDGQPLTARDSLYSYQLANDPATPVSRNLLDRTAEYRAVDEITVAWTGIPGYRPERFSDAFFIPLPEHAWSGYSAEELLSAEESTRRPLGWGPYVIEEWIPAEYLRLRSNPNYFRAGEGLPRFDLLTFHFLGEQADNNLAALNEDVCDIVDQTTLLEEIIYTVADQEAAGKVKTYASLGPEWAHLDFGIRLAAYDGGYNPWSGYRQDIFSDVRVRKAFTLCMDRQLIIDQLLYGHSQIPAGFFPPGHPFYAADLQPLPYDPAEGMRLLDQAGWRDLDGDPSTPRTALGVANVLNGAPLQVTYLTTPDRLGRGSAERLASSLAGCGIQVEIQTQRPEQLFAPGPDGPLFGRSFDLAQFSWASGRGSPCFVYTSEQIPSAQNGWLGTNVTGFSDEQYDRACQAALQAGQQPDDEGLAAQIEVQRLYAEMLPSVPLYYEIRLSASRPDLCGMEADASARSEFWNLEAIDYGEECP
jgi:peptide/nickel transport system substrate-binding protein